MANEHEKLKTRQSFKGRNLVEASIAKVVLEFVTRTLKIRNGKGKVVRNGRHPVGRPMNIVGRTNFFGH